MESYSLIHTQCTSGMIIAEIQPWGTDEEIDRFFLEILTKLLPRALNTMVFVLLSVAFPDNLCSSSQDPKG